MKEFENKKKFRTLDYLLANLLDYFRDPRREYKFLHAAVIADNLICRMANRKLPLKKRFLVFANRLNNNLSPASLRDFSMECFEYANKLDIMPERKSDARPSSLKALQKKAEKELGQSLAIGHSKASAIQRAANELFKVKKAHDSYKRFDDLAKNHPLRETFLVLANPDRPLAKEDVKSQLLQLKRPDNQGRQNQGVLRNLLERAQAFSICRLHSLLGDELFYLCRPLGFLDQNTTTVLVEVPTSAHLHALTYRKLEILRCLKNDSAFVATKNIKFRVKGNDSSL